LHKRGAEIIVGGSSRASTFKSCTSSKGIGGTLPREEKKRQFLRGDGSTRGGKREKERKGDRGGRGRIKGKMADVVEYKEGNPACAPKGNHKL